MKQAILILLTLEMFACNSPADNTEKLEVRIDSLERKVADNYKPGLGEFMNNIQVHHNKLWFAGQNQNWKLADFEIKEIKEALDDIKQYCMDRPETRSIDMLDQPIQNLTTAIQQENSVEFKNSYILLTSTCNSCHQVTHHDFNVIKIPTTPPFSNQTFNLPNEKSK